jgi:hypothetical protein
MNFSSHILFYRVALTFVASSVDPNETRVIRRAQCGRWMVCDQAVFYG